MPLKLITPHHWPKSFLDDEEDLMRFLFADVAKAGHGVVCREDAASPFVSAAIHRLCDDALEVLHECAISAPAEHVGDAVVGVGAVNSPVDEGLHEEDAIYLFFPELVDFGEVLKVPRFDEVEEGLVEEDREISCIAIAFAGSLDKTEMVVETDNGIGVAEGGGRELKLVYLDDTTEECLGDASRLGEGDVALLEEVLNSADLVVRKVENNGSHLKKKKSLCVFE